MLRTLTFVCFAACVVGTVIAQPTSTGTETKSDKRFALVIGNSTYQHMGALSNPANDAREMAAALRAMAVNVEVLLDADREVMMAALAKLARTTEYADLAIVHYSGHGVEINGNNYLLPVSAELNQSGDADTQAITFEQVYAAINRATGVKLILLDACRDNSIPGRLGLPPRRGLSAPSPSGNILVAYATRHGEVAQDGPPGGTSPFTGALVRNIGRPIDIRTMFQKVRDDVLVATDLRQSPFTYGHFTSAEYVLAPMKSKAP